MNLPVSSMKPQIWSIIRLYCDDWEGYYFNWTLYEQAHGVSMDRIFEEIARRGMETNAIWKSIEIPDDLMEAMGDEFPTRLMDAKLPIDLEEFKKQHSY